MVKVFSLFIWMNGLCGVIKLDFLVKGLFGFKGFGFLQSFYIFEKFRFSGKLEIVFFYENKCFGK